MSIAKQVTYCSIGTIFEWYEFTVFIYLTPIITRLFFPQSTGLEGMMASLGVFASGYLMRPLGAILFGHLGDRLGRKKTLVLTIFLMSFATAGMGLIPTGHAYSIALLMLCRMIQGLACSGEYPSSLALLAEQKAYRHRSFVVSSGLFATAIGSFCGALMYALLVHVMPADTLEQWGWRVPFLIGAPIGIFGYYLRRRVSESSAFSQLQAKGLALASPVIELLKNHYRVLLGITCIYSFNNILIYMDIAYFGNYALSIHKITAANLIVVNLAVSFSYALAILFFGFLADYVNKKTLLMTGVCLTTLFLYPLFSLALHGSLAQQIFAQVSIAILVGMLLGPLTLMAALSFPILVRCSGLSIAVNIGGAVFGGTAPLVCTWLTGLTQASITPVYYALFFGVLAILSSQRCFKKNG